jgi:cytochrome c-type protein NapC
MVSQGTSSDNSVGRLKRLWQAVSRSGAKTAIGTILAAGFVWGVLFWGGFNWAMELTNTESFCVSCHVMEVNPYKEYKTTIHHSNRSGVRATCPDCHVPKQWVHKVSRKVMATNELFHWFIGSINTREKFEAKRPELAGRVWASMQETDSRECRNCHSFEFMTEETQSPTAGLMHSLADEWGKTCIDCHKGIAHNLPKGISIEKTMDEMHDRMEETGIECGLCHKGMAGADADDGW